MPVHENSLCVRRVLHTIHTKVRTVSLRRLAMHNGVHSPGRQLELAPTKNLKIPEATCRIVSSGIECFKAFFREIDLRKKHSQNTKILIYQ